MGKNNGIEKLNLNNNKLEDNATSGILSFLQHNSSLKALYLSNC